MVCVCMCVWLLALFVECNGYSSYSYYYSSYYSYSYYYAYYSYYYLLL